MAISKRLRFEVFRRDNHTCRYCGTTAGEAELAVDHVVPRSLGGGDEPSNLVAACVDCNVGKSSSHPDAPLVEQVSEDALRWAHAMDQAAKLRRAEVAVVRAAQDALEAEWQRNRSRHGRWCDLPAGWRVSVEQFLTAGLDADDLVGLVDVAFASPASDKWRYFCGCCWTTVRTLQESARQLIGAEPSARSSVWDWEEEKANLDAFRAAVEQLARERFASPPPLPRCACSATECRSLVCAAIGLASCRVGLEMRSGGGADAS